MDTVHTAITEPVRRLEVFTGAGRRRKWSDEDKARIVAEIVSSVDSVCSVARRHGLSPQQLFGWRRQLREAAGGHSEADEVQFGTARFIVRPFVRSPAGGSTYRTDNQCSFSADVRSRAAPLCALTPTSARRPEPTIAPP
ncbi:transposase [Bradyrhizobium embrapense]|uniref:transposase n=1 Tax=Bradyrhizobium embrapense TaxID=630921 RepID=UPI0009FE8685|nr:transposase [Bradyrhizobium embrapense]